MSTIVTTLQMFKRKDNLLDISWKKTEFRIEELS